MNIQERTYFSDIRRSNAAPTHPVCRNAPSQAIDRWRHRFSFVMRQAFFAQSKYARNERGAASC
jgi:hypothetical protein